MESDQWMCFGSVNDLFLLLLMYAGEHLYNVIKQRLTFELAYIYISCLTFEFEHI